MFEIRQEGDYWVLYVNGQAYDAYDSEAEAQAAQAALQQETPAPVAESDAPPQAATSVALTERPFVIDGVRLNEAQISRLSRLVEGTARPNGGGPLELPAAIDLWRRQNHTRTLASGKQVWQVHSASPTYRERFTEAAHIAEGDAEGREWRIVCITEGWSNNGRYYTRRSLEGAVPLFQGVRVRQYGWDPYRREAGHLPESIRRAVPGLYANDVGEVTDPVGRVNEAGKFEIVGTWHCTDLALGGKVREAFTRDHSRAPGFSIDGIAEMEHGVAEGRRGDIVHALRSLDELTLVDKPAAGGRIERLVAGNTHQEETNPMYKHLRKRIMARLQESERTKTDDLDAKGLLALATEKKVVEEIEDAALLQIVRKYIDSQPEVAADLLDSYLGALNKSPEQPAEPAPETSAMPAMEATKRAEEAAKRAAEAEQRVTEAAQRAAVTECRTRLRDMLQASRLPEITQKKIQKVFEGQVFEDKTVLEAIEEERGYLAAFDPDGQVTGTRATESRDVRVVTEAIDRYQAGWDRLFGVKPENEQQQRLQESTGVPSLRRLYVEMTGDTEIRGRYAADRIQEATTATLAEILGNTLNRRMVQAFREYPFYWEPFTNIVDGIDNFKPQYRPRMNEFSGLPIVPESDSADYPDLGFPTDDQSTYTPDTRGGMISLTRRMVMNDDLGQLRQMPQMLARGARHQLNLDIGNAIWGNAGGAGINTDTVYDGLAIGHANHRNLQALGLDFDGIDAGRQKLEEQFVYGQKTTVAATGTSFNNTTDPVKVTVASSVGFLPGKLAICGAEIVRVVSVDDATHITFSRGKEGTTPAAHADGSAIYQLGASIPLSKIHLLASTANRTLVNKILYSERQPGTLNNDYNPYYGMQQKGELSDIVVPPQYMGGYRENWALLADKKDIPMVELGFVNNRQEPELFLQDAPTVGYVFTRDVLRYKVRLEYGYVVLEWRGIVMSIVGK